MEIGQSFGNVGDPIIGEVSRAPRREGAEPIPSDTESRFLSIEKRLAAIEEFLERGDVAFPLLASGSPISEGAEAAPSRGAEYWIGAKLVPRLGAVLIILAIAFVAVSESSKNSTFDRSLLLGVEALFCLAFIAFGEWKRNEMEGFGPTLSAIGSCGLYLTAAGGHFAYHQLSAAGMAVGFAGLTLLNHGFALWRSTRLFFFIGASGGLAAMLFPLAEKDYGTALAVYVTVTVAGAVVCSIRKWLQLAMVGWFLSLLIIAPIIDSDYSRVAVIASMYVAALACIAAAVRSTDGEELDPPALLGAVAFFVTGCLGFWVLHDRGGVVHLAILAAAGTVLWSVFGRKSYAGRALLVGSIVTGALLIPLCFTFATACLAYAGLSVLAFAIGRIAFRKLTAVFAAGALVASAITYILAARTASIREQDVALLSLFGALVLSALALRRAGYGWIGYLVASFWVLLMRGAALMSSNLEPGQITVSYLTVASVVYALLLLVLGFRMHSSNLRLWSFGVMLASVFQVLLLDTETSIGSRILALVALGGMMLIGGYRYLRDQRSIPSG